MPLCPFSGIGPGFATPSSGFGKKHGRYLRREFSYEKFQQTLLLPDDVDAEKIEAKKEKIQRAESVKQIAIQ